MFKHNYTLFLLLLLINLLLTTCNIYIPSNVTKKQVSLEWQSHRQLLSILNRYQFYSAFGYLSKRQKFYARLNWKQASADYYQIILKNPIGKTEIDLNVKPGIAQLINNRGKCYVSSNNPEVIIQALTNMSIPPFNELKQWILGLPGNATNFTLNSRGYLNTLNYNYKGELWTVIYHSYHNNTFPALPSNIELRKEDICIKLKIDNWSLY